MGLGGGCMFFVGTHELSIDQKHRLSIPFAVRRKLDPQEDGESFYVLPGKRPGTLALYPDKYFEKLRAGEAPEAELGDEAYQWRQFEYSQCWLMETDNQGRVLIPERLLKRVGIQKEVTLIGVHDHLELWDRAAFNAFQDENWPTYAEKRARAMRERKLNGPPHRDSADRPNHD